MENSSGRDTLDLRSVGRNPVSGVHHQRARQEEQGGYYTG